MTPCVWRILCLRNSYPTFGNQRIYQLQHAETKSAPNVVRLLSVETECPPKVPLCPHSTPKPKPKPKFGRPLIDGDDIITLAAVEREAVLYRRITDSINKISA